MSLVVFLFIYTSFSWRTFFFVSTVMKAWGKHTAGVTLDEAKDIVCHHLVKRRGSTARNIKCTLCGAREGMHDAYVMRYVCQNDDCLQDGRGCPVQFKIIQCVRSGGCTILHTGKHAGNPPLGDPIVTRRRGPSKKAKPRQKE